MSPIACSTEAPPHAATLSSIRIQSAAFTFAFVPRIRQDRLSRALRRCFFSEHGLMEAEKADGVISEAVREEQTVYTHVVCLRRIMSFLVLSAMTKPTVWRM